MVGSPVDAADDVLTSAALAFVTELHDRFAIRLEHLLAERHRRQDMVFVGEPMDFLPETAAVRAGDWAIAPIPDGLADGLSGARSVDLSDGISPTWPNLMGRSVLRGTVRSGSGREACTSRRNI